MKKSMRQMFSSQGILTAKKTNDLLHKGLSLLIPQFLSPRSQVLVIMALACRRHSLCVILITALCVCLAGPALSRHREHGHQASLAAQNGRKRVSRLRGSDPKLLTLITTHMSSQHYEYLKNCWPRLLATLPLFQRSDFAMYVTKNRTQEIDMDFINSVFARHGIVTFIAHNPGKQAGAIAALTEGFKNSWFAGYDWVIRVNPDVLIRNDSFILEQMRDPSVSGIFDDCLDVPCPAGNGCVGRLIHTDFFAIRPCSISADALMQGARTNATSAELMATEAFSSIIKCGADAWLPGTGPHHGECRVVGVSSPVIHDHSLSDKCAGGL